MRPGFEGNGDRDVRPQSWVSSARANSGVSRTVRPSPRECSGEGVPSAAAVGRIALPTGLPDGEPEEIDAAHLPAVLEGLAQAKRRQFASDAGVEAAFRRFDR